MGLRFPVHLTFYIVENLYLYEMSLELRSIEYEGWMWSRHL